MLQPGVPCSVICIKESAGAGAGLQLTAVMCMHCLILLSLDWTTVYAQAGGSGAVQPNV